MEDPARRAARFDFTLGAMIGLCLFTLASCGDEVSHASTGPRAPEGFRIFTSEHPYFSIAYPGSWTVDESYVYPMRIDGRELRGVSFTVPERFRKGTNLGTDTRLTVEIAPGVRTCDARVFLDPAETELTETNGGRTWSVANGDDAGAGNLYDETVYALAGSSPCLAIRYFIHATNIANYDPGTVKAYDRTALITTFDRMRETLALRAD